MFREFYSLLIAYAITLGFSIIRRVFRVSYSVTVKGVLLNPALEAKIDYDKTSTYLGAIVSASGEFYSSIKVDKEVEANSVEASKLVSVTVEGILKRTRITAFETSLITYYKRTVKGKFTKTI